MDTSPEHGRTVATRTQWGLTPQAALNVGNHEHVLSDGSGIVDEATARAAQARLGGIIRRREVTTSTTDWYDVD